MGWILFNLISYIYSTIYYEYMIINCLNIVSLYCGIYCYLNVNKFKYYSTNKFFKKNVNST